MDRSPSARALVRGILAVTVGLVAISALTEGLELGIVTLLNGGPVTDPDAYFAVRNRPVVLGAKLVYNSAFAAAGGRIAAWIAAPPERPWVLGLAGLQTVLLIWGALALEMAAYTPAWMWIALVLLTGPAIFAGGVIGRGKRAPTV